MIDPDGIVIQNVNLPSNIKIKEVPEFALDSCYCLEDEKEYNKFITDTERNVRRSMEYREFIKYLRENMQMNKCAFLQGVDNTETFDIRIELHHYPFSLHDIVEIVLRKRQYYNESVTLQAVSKEVMSLHYKLMVGLIPLSETVHELAHSSRLFIPVDKVIGRYNLFVDYYKPFIDPDQLETLSRIEKYSEENRSNILNTSILNQTNVSYVISDPRYMIPEYNNINTKMIEQIKAIKENNYMLPSVNDKPYLEDKSNPRKLISLDPTIINTTGKYSWEL